EPPEQGGGAVGRCGGRGSVHSRETRVLQRAHFPTTVLAAVSTRVRRRSNLELTPARGSGYPPADFPTLGPRMGPPGHDDPPHGGRRPRPRRRPPGRQLGRRPVP